MSQSVKSVALAGGGKINKKRCGDEIFRYGLRFFTDFMQGLAQKSAVEREELFRGDGIREMWQTFMTGNYYYCFQCQAQCPATCLPTS